MKKLNIIILLSLFLLASVLAYDPINSLVLTSTADGTIINESFDFAILNWTFLGYNVSQMDLSYNGTNSTIAMTNCSNTTIISGERLKYFCSFNKTGLGAAYANTWYITINDTDDTRVTSETRTIRIDNGKTQIGTPKNWTASDSVLSYNVTVTDTTPSICEAQILEVNASGSYNNLYTSTGTYGTIGAYDTSSYCTGTIDASSLTYEGNFISQYKVGDMLGNTNYTNQSGIFTKVYEGWNIIAWADAASTGGTQEIYEICDAIEYCDIATWQNNSNGSSSFITYDTTTPSVNNDTAITAGDGLLIHVTANS